MMPGAGGMYVYFREAFGELPAFLYAWVAYWVILAGADAAVAVGFAEYFAVFFPGLAHAARRSSRSGPLPISAGQLVAVVADPRALGDALRRRHARAPGSRASSRSLIVARAALDRGRRRARARRRPAAAARLRRRVPITAAAFGTAMIAVFWCFYGWNEIVAVAGEVASPERNLPARADRRHRASSRCSTSASTRRS